MVPKKSLFFTFAVILVILSLNFVFSKHVSSPSTLSVNVSRNSFYNISVNNTGVTQIENITEINISLPSVFTFILNSNESNRWENATFANFTNATTIDLIWKNTTGYLINGSINRSYFSFNATASATGRYNITIYSVNATGVYNTTLSVRVQDTSAPVITLISPVNNNATIQAPVVNFTFNVTDVSSDSVVNCSLILNGVRVNINSSVNTTGGHTGFTNFTYQVNNTWRVNCTDSDSNVGNSSTYSFSLISFDFNGTAKDEDGNALNNSVVNVTIRSQAGWTVLTYPSGASNASGWFNFSIPSNSSWIYEPSIIHRNLTGLFVDFKSKSLPAFPSQMMQILSGITFYLTPAGTINITAINTTGDRVPFQYQVKDTKLGYPVAEDHQNWATEVNVYVPRNRNYSIMIYPNQSMPVSYNWNNFSSNITSDMSIDGGKTNISRWDASNFTFHKQFNTSMTMTRVIGYVVNESGFPSNASSLVCWNNFTIIPYLVEPGNMIHSQYGAMPYNLSAFYAQSDLYNASTGFFNISLPATAETSTILLFASLVNATKYYGGFKNVSLTYGIFLTNTTNITVYGLLGTSDNITIDRVDGGGQNIAINTSKQIFTLVNGTNTGGTLGNTSAHVETTVDYSNYGAMEFTWMTDIQQSQSVSNFALPILNITGIKEMNVFASGGPSGSTGQYAPKRVGTKTAAEITANPNISISVFNPGAINASLTSSQILITLYTSNSTCDVPNPPSSCNLSSSATLTSFNPMQTVMGGGKISFRMGTSSGILVHYVNVDMLASGPPDALFDSSANTTGTSTTTFASALRFGSQGPTIYDYVITSIPYAEGTDTQTGLNESANVSMYIPKLYDDSWNVVWNTALNGTAAGTLAGNYSHYSTYQNAWGNLTTSKNCTKTVTELSATTPCYMDILNNRIWIRLPHFSGTQPLITGGIVTAGSSSSSSSSSGVATLAPWINSQGLTNDQFAQGYTKEYAAKYRVTFTIGSVSHAVGVVSLTSTQAVINVSSTPQQKTMSIGDEWKVEVTDDKYYDVYVKLNSINNNKANLTVKSMHEEIVATPPAAVQEEKKTVAETVAETVKETANLAKSPILWVILVVVIVVIAVIFLIYKKKRYSRKGY